MTRANDPEKPEPQITLKPLPALPNVADVKWPTTLKDAVEMHLAARLAADQKRILAKQLYSKALLESKQSSEEKRKAEGHLAAADVECEAAYLEAKELSLRYYVTHFNQPKVEGETS